MRTIKFINFTLLTAACILLVLCSKEKIDSLPWSKSEQSPRNGSVIIIDSTHQDTVIYVTEK